jgi:transaldolase
VVQQCGFLRVRYLLLLLSVQVMKQMAMHPLTDKGLQAFVNDWEQAKSKQKNSL